MHRAALALPLDDRHRIRHVLHPTDHISSSARGRRSHDSPIRDRDHRFLLRRAGPVAGAIRLRRSGRDRILHGPGVRRVPDVFARLAVHLPSVGDTDGDAGRCWVSDPSQGSVGRAGEAAAGYSGRGPLDGGLILLSFVLSSGGVYGWNKSFIIALLVTSVVILVVFTYLEKKVSNPVMPLSLWKIQNFAGL